MLQGLDAALERKKRERPPIEPILDGEKEARLIALACSQPPKGRSRWSCSPTSWLNSTSSRASPVGPCNGRSKKRTQAPSENVLGDSAQGKRRIRSLHGESSGSVSPAPSGLKYIIPFSGVSTDLGNAIRHCATYKAATPIEDSRNWRNNLSATQPGETALIHFFRQTIA